MATDQLEYFDSENFPETKKDNLTLVTGQSDTIKDYIAIMLNYDSYAMWSDVEFIYDLEQGRLQNISDLVVLGFSQSEAEKICDVYELDLTKEQIKEIIWGCALDPIC